MDRILFGDNQFFGINHVSDEKSRQLSIKFRKDDAVLKTLKIVQQNSVNSFMCTTHDRMIDISKAMHQDLQLRKMNIYPCLPYAHKYANAVTELGIMGTVKQYVPGNFMTSLLKGGVAYVSKDYISMMELMVDAELKMFKNATTPVVFLQNVVTDLLLGLGMGKVLKAFHDHIKNKYNVEAGFITMNLPKLTELLQANGIAYPIICSSINHEGFRMSGGKTLYEQYLEKGKSRNIAMQIFSGGSSAPDQSIKYVCSLPNIQSVLFGASSDDNIIKTVSMIRQYDTIYNK
ncbi:MAG: hypothetical protein RI991_736 [Bacteroidota bacterium]|jgi:hypothetical protein